MENEKLKDGEVPIDDDTVWGCEDPAEPVICPLFIDGRCPEGCRACRDFEESLNHK